MRGGYRADGRLATNGDEVVITAIEWFRARTPEDRKRIRGEMAALVRERLTLIASANGPQPPLGFTGGA